MAHTMKDVFKRALILSLSVYIITGASFYVYATGGAFPYTKHGGGTTDGALPHDAGNGPGVDRSVNPAFTSYYNDATVEGGKYRGGECVHCHEPHASFGGSEPAPNSGVDGDVGGGPNPYLVLSDNDPNACWFCHENLTNIGGSGSPPGYGRFGFYQGRARYEQSGHYTNTTMKNPGYGAGSPWPRTDRTTTVTSGHCVNCHTPHGILETAGGEYDTWAVPATKHLSTNNPDVSKDYLIPRQLIAWEEALCENCHRAVGEGGLSQALDIRTQIAKLEGTYGVTGSGHPVHDVDQLGGTTNPFSGRHSLKNEENPAAGWNAYPDSRHVECVDCHNPHAAQPGTVFQPSGTTTTNPNRVAGTDGIYAGGANKGVWGVSVDTVTGNVTGRVDDTSPATQTYSSVYLYELCLKCHSSFGDSAITTRLAPSWENRRRWDATDGSAGDADDYHFSIGDTQPMYLTDVAQDFAMATGDTPPKGYHPVFGLGRNRPPSTANCRWTRTRLDGTCTPVSGGGEDSNRPTGVRDTTIGFDNTFVPPWGQNKLVTCVDCHESENETDPRGPHGSAQPFILRKLDTTITYTIQDDGYDGNGTGPYTVSYSCFDQAWASSTTDAYAVYCVNLGQFDPNNFCLNCHRADVYGFLDQGATTGSWNCGDDRFPRYRYLSRQPHPADGNCGGMMGANGLSFASDAVSNSAGDSPRGIVCMRCHGGGTVGGIHGNSGAPGFSYDVSIITPSSNRLINGAAWDWVRFGSTAGRGRCGKNGGNSNFNDCTHNSGGSFDTYATYDY